MAYCTSDDLKELGYTWDDDTDLDNLTAICDTASRSIDAYCKQTFVANSAYTENGKIMVRDGEFKYFPKNLTINSITSISFKAINGEALDYTIQNYEYEADNACIFGYTTAPSGIYRVTIVYDFGYDSSSYPDELVKATVLAATMFIDKYFFAQSTNTSGIKSIKQGQLSIQSNGSSISSVNKIVALPQESIDILNGGNNGIGYVRVRSII